MGLDSVELVMEIEETFGIVIPDAEAEKIQTMGQAYHYILAKMEGPLTTTGCLSAAAFYRVRRQLMGRFRVERRRIRPAAALEDLIPKEGRQEAWRQLGEALGWRLPALGFPAWVWRAWVAAFVGLAAADLAAWHRWAGLGPDAGGLALWGFVIAAIPMAIAMQRLTRPFATVLPAADLRGLIPTVVAANFGTFRINNPQGWTSREVWDALVALVSEQMGVSPEILTESTRFVNDLGVD
jgi:acyl carrier protein